MIHLLHDDTLTQENREKFLRTTQKYSQNIDFVNVEKYKNLFSDDMQKIVSGWTLGSLYRLFIPDVLDIDKIIYLDCDVIVNMDIKKLWEFDMDGMSLIGAKDLANPRWGDNTRAKLLGCDNKLYINSGVIVMNLEKIRKLGSFFKITTDFIIKHKDLILAPDQDALNAIFRGDIKIIDNKFNSHFNMLTEVMPDCIIHFLAWKPWAEITGKQSDRNYWKMYIRSAWGENTSRDELIDIFNNLASKTAHSVLYHHTPMQCVKRISFSIWIRLCSPFRLIKYFTMAIFYSIKYGHKK